MIGLDVCLDQRLELSQCLRHECRLEFTEVYTVLPKTETEFGDEGMAWQLLPAFRASEKRRLAATTSGWRSWVDLVFVTVFPEYAGQCFAMYDGNGKQLRHIISAATLRKMDSECVLHLRGLRQTYPGLFDTDMLLFSELLKICPELERYRQYPIIPRYDPGAGHPMWPANLISYQGNQALVTAKKWMR